MNKAERDERMRSYYLRALAAQERGERFEVTPDEFDEMKRMQAEIDAERDREFPSRYRVPDYLDVRALADSFAGIPIFVEPA